MAVQRTHWRVFLVISLVALAGSLFPMPSGAVTQQQVDEACSDSQEQLAEARAARAAFEEAALDYEDALNDVEFLERKQERIQGNFDAHAEDLEAVQSQLEEQAVQMYMMGGFNNPGIIFSASTVDEVMTTTEFLNSATLGGQESINDLIAAMGELSRFQDDLSVVHEELKVAEAGTLLILCRREEAMLGERAAVEWLCGRC
jgi:hypothetical protein